MKIYNPEDMSLIELLTDDQSMLKLRDIDCDSREVNEYAKIIKANYDLIVDLEEQVTKHGQLNIKQTLEEKHKEIGNMISGKLEGYNMLSLFSLTKKT